jgi:DNA-binding transcriptional MocR family regulator
MSQRIRQLEDALQIAQATISSQPHPLLSEDLLSVKTGVDDVTGENVPPKEDLGDDEEEGMINALGTLKVSAPGDSTFMGRVSAEVCSRCN